MKRHLAVYVPMLVGACVGWLASEFGGWPGVVGMGSGAAVWLAYELRQNTRRLEVDMKMMQRELEWIQKDWTH